jgi:hypothetical protein
MTSFLKALFHCLPVVTERSSYVELQNCTRNLQFLERFYIDVDPVQQNCDYSRPVCARVVVHLTSILYRPVVGYNSKPGSHRGYTDCTVP